MKVSNSSPASSISKVDPSVRNTLLFLLVSLLSGFVVGVLTFFGQGILPDGVGQLANSGAVWVIVAFVLGRFAPGWPVASLAGFLALCTELAGYYVTAHFSIGTDATLAALGLWLVVAFVAGPVFGAAGFVSRNGSGWWHKVATASLGATFIGEGSYLMLILPALWTGLLWLVIGFAITLLLTRTARERIEGCLLTAAIGLGFFGFEGILVWMDSLRASTFTG